MKTKGCCRAQAHPPQARPPKGGRIETEIIALAWKSISDFPRKNSFLRNEEGIFFYKKRGELMISELPEKKEVNPMRSDYIDPDTLHIVLALLMPQNRLICQLAIKSGLRIGDIISIRTDQLAPRITIREAKTGKSRRISIAPDLLREIKAQAGPVWAFPGRPGSKTGHKTRQAIWSDIKRAAEALRLQINLSPHSIRKMYAVRLYHQSGDLELVRRRLNHTDLSISMIYAMADHIRNQPHQSRPHRRRRSKATQ